MVNHSILLLVCVSVCLCVSVPLCLCVSLCVPGTLVQRSKRCAFFRDMLEHKKQASGAHLQCIPHIKTNYENNVLHTYSSPIVYICTC